MDLGLQHLGFRVLHYVALCFWLQREQGTGARPGTQKRLLKLLGKGSSRPLTGQAGRTVSLVLGAARICATGRREPSEQEKLARERERKGKHGVLTYLLNLSELTGFCFSETLPIPVFFSQCLPELVLTSSCAPEKKFPNPLDKGADCGSSFKKPTGFTGA